MNAVNPALTAISPSPFLPNQPMRPLKATATTSQPVLTIQQVDTIFYKIQDIFEMHKEFYDALLPSVQQWDEKVTVGHLFQKLVSPMAATKVASVNRSRVACRGRWKIFVVLIILAWRPDISAGDTHSV